MCPNLLFSPQKIETPQRPPPAPDIKPVKIAKGNTKKRKQLGVKKLQVPLGGIATIGSDTNVAT